VREIDTPIVLDADGLNALATDRDAAAERSASARGPLVITPHPGEAARLLGTSIAQVQSDRMGSVRELARRYSAVAVLKGRHTLIADTTGAVGINTTGNPGMASGGMGDTLTGIVGAIAAQGFARRPETGHPATPLLFAVCLAVHIHGIAGDLAAALRGEAGLTASDVIDRAPEAISSLSEEV
jgi:NAD(P)H-hydrate epimerase